MTTRFVPHRPTWNIFRNGTPDPIGYITATEKIRQALRRFEDEDGNIQLSIIITHAETILLQQARDTDRVFLERPF